MWGAEAQATWPSSTAFPAILAGSWMLASRTMPSPAVPQTIDVEGNRVGLL